MQTFAAARSLHPDRADAGASTARHDHDHPGGALPPSEAAARATVALVTADLKAAAYWSGYARTVGALVG